jgi:DNA-binding transcriptional ArsR family regulator
MRVVDLRRPSRQAPPTVEVRASAGAELLRFAYVVSDREARGTFDVGGQRLEDLEAKLPADLVDQLQVFEREDKCFLMLSRIAVDLPQPYGVEQLFAHLDADPAAAWRLLAAGEIVGGHVPLGDGAPPDPDDLAVQLLAGDPEPVEAVQRAVRRQGNRAGQGSLLTEDPTSVGEQVLKAVTQVHDILWDDLAEEAMGAIERDAAHRRRQLDEGVSLEQLILEATNGYELDREEPLHRVVLMPSYWLRPWLSVGHIGGVEVISSVVADEFVQLPSEAPPPALLKLFKALGDESRLRLLRLMAHGPVSLTEASQELDVAKATAHHHLAILRQAGLVSMRSKGRGARYALRGDPPAAAREALAAYVPAQQSQQSQQS